MAKFDSSILEGTLQEEYRSLRCNGDTADLIRAGGPDGHCSDISNDNDNLAECAGIRRYVVAGSDHALCLIYTIDDVDGALRDKIRLWLKPPDPTTNYNTAVEARQVGTGAWLIQSQDFVDWMTTRGSFMWICGIRASGNTHILE